MATPRADKVRGLVLANTFAWTPDRWALRAMLRFMGGGLMTAIDTGTNLIPKLSSTTFGVGRNLERSGRQAFLGPFRDRNVRRRFHRLMRSTIEDAEFTDAVAHGVAATLARTPALTIFGEKNDPFGFQERHASVFTTHQAIVVEAGNHFPMMDDPTLFVDSLRSWHTREVASRITS